MPELDGVRLADTVSKNRSPSVKITSVKLKLHIKILDEAVLKILFASASFSSIKTRNKNNSSLIRFKERENISFSLP